MKLSDIYIGKIVRGIEGKVLPNPEQENPKTPIGHIIGLTIRPTDQKVIPVVRWAGTDLYGHGCDLENLQEVEE